MHATRKGQGATEYLVLLAVVLIVAMVAIALLGFFPGITGDVQSDQSKAYWTGVARPFTIQEHLHSSAQTFAINMRNSGTERLYLEDVKIGRAGTNLTSNAALRNSVKVSVVPVLFYPGQNEVIVFQNVQPNCVPGSKYAYVINFTYRTDDLSGKMQIGAKELIGNCRP